jgi:hypothetical protein
VPTPQPPTPECEIDVYNRPIEATHGLNIPGAQHGYIVFTDQYRDQFTFESKKSNKQLTAVTLRMEVQPSRRIIHQMIISTDQWVVLKCATGWQSFKAVPVRLIAPISDTTGMDLTAARC